MGAITHLLDHTARVWRRVETIGTLGDTIVTYDLAYDELACAEDGQNSVAGNPGAGQTPIGRRWVYFDVGPTIRFRDVIELVSGPNAPAALEVESSDNRRGHHLEIQASEFRGKLPEEAGS